MFVLLLKRTSLRKNKKEYGKGQASFPSSRSSMKMAGGGDHEESNRISTGDDKDASLLFRHPIPILLILSLQLSFQLSLTLSFPSDSRYYSPTLIIIIIITITASVYYSHLSSSFIILIYRYFLSCRPMLVPMLYTIIVLFLLILIPILIMINLPHSQAGRPPRPLLAGANPGPCPARPGCVERC